MHGFLVRGAGGTPPLWSQTPAPNSFREWFRHELYKNRPPGPRNSKGPRLRPKGRKSAIFCGKRRAGGGGADNQDRMHGSAGLWPLDIALWQMLRISGGDPASGCLCVRPRLRGLCCQAAKKRACDDRREAAPPGRVAPARDSRGSQGESSPAGASALNTKLLTERRPNTRPARIHTRAPA